MIQYPLTFRVESNSASGISKAWSTSVPTMHGGLVAAIPAEFEGPGGGYSPEDFYALAMLNCFAATFKVMAERSNLTFTEIRLAGALTVERNESGSPWMKHFLMQIQLEGASDTARARRLLEKTSQSCIVLNSVKTEKEFQFEIS